MESIHMRDKNRVLYSYPSYVLYKGWKVYSVILIPCSLQYNDIVYSLHVNTPYN